MSFVGPGFDSEVEVPQAFSLALHDELYLLLTDQPTSAEGHGILAVSRNPEPGYTRFRVTERHKAERFGVSCQIEASRVHLPSLLPFMRPWMEEAELRQRVYHLYDLPKDRLLPHDTAAARFAAGCRRMSQGVQFLRPNEMGFADHEAVSLGTYLVLTGFEILGGKAEYVDFDRWLSKKADAQGRACGDLFKEWRSVYGPVRSFRRFFDYLDPETRVVLSSSFRIWRIRIFPPLPDEKRGVLLTEEDAIDLLYEIRSQYTHRALGSVPFFQFAMSSTEGRWERCWDRPKGDGSVELLEMKDRVVFLLRVVGGGLAGFLRVHGHLDADCEDAATQVHRRRVWREDGWNVGFPQWSKPE